jgi:hypothetical protein
VSGQLRGYFNFAIKAPDNGINAAALSAAGQHERASPYYAQLTRHDNVEVQDGKSKQITIGNIGPNEEASFEIYRWCANSNVIFLSRNSVKIVYSFYLCSDWHAYDISNHKRGGFLTQR